MASAPAEPLRPASLRAGGHTAAFAQGVVRVGPVELVVAVSDDGPGLRVDWSVRNPGRAEVRPGALAIGVDASPERVLDTVRSAGRSGDQPLELVDPFARELRVRSRAQELAVDPSGAGRRPSRPGAPVVLDTPAGWLARR